MGLAVASDFAVYTEMGPTLLSLQPTDPSEKAPDWGDEWPSIYEHCEASMSSMRTWRYSWWGYWARLAEFFQPRRYHWLITPNRMNKGQAINDNIIDGSPTLALNTCASGMWSGFTNPDFPWIGLAPTDKNFQLDNDGRQWLDDIGDIIYDTIDGSNFYTEMAQMFNDLACFGTAPIIVYEDFYDKVRLYLPCSGEYFCKAGARFSIDTLAREFCLTVQQLVEMFGYDQLAADVQKLFTEGGSGLQDEYVVYHLIEPNFDLTKRGSREKIKVVPGRFTYREIYWLKGREDGGPLSRRGFHMKPFSVFRWSKVSNDPYGRSPCMDALGDNKQVQRSTIRKGEFIEKLVRPPMGAEAELKNEPQSILPGMTTYLNTAGGKKGFFPLFEMSPAALTPLVEDIREVDQRIDRALFVDVFMAITQMQGVQPRNELELTKRDLERLQKLGPVITLVENSIAEIITRILDILSRRGQLPPKPASLRGVQLKYEFETIMRRAQRAAKSVAMKDTFVTAGELSAAAKAAQVPDPIRTLDLDKALRTFAQDNMFPPDCIFTDAEVEKHDQARVAAVKQAQMPQQALAGVQAAKILSDTPTGPGTALSGMMGQGGQ